MRLIDADALMAEWEEPRDWLDRDQVLRHYTWFKVVIESQPTIEAVPVRHGRWNRVGDIDWECTACGGFSCCNGAYCPDCGAKMDGAEDDPEEN